MGYCATDEVKDVLQIDLAETKLILSWRIASPVQCGLVDGLLKPKELDCSCSGPSAHRDASKYFAAWMFRRFR